MFMIAAVESSNKTYNRHFADYYDKITQHKDYRAEIDSLVKLIRESVSDPNARILDVGCGTGNHAVLLAERGYDVTAIDLSPDMIRIASAKNSKAKFKSGDIGQMPETGFQFCYSLFNVINCLNSLSQLIDFFKAISAHLVDGGTVFIESWNPIAVIAAPPEVVERTYEAGGEEIVRKVVPEWDFLRQRLNLRYDVVVHSRPQRNQPKVFTVVHELLLFTPLEIEYALQQAGLTNIRIRTALPEVAEAKADDRMLAFTAEKQDSQSLSAFRHQR